MNFEVACFKIGLKNCFENLRYMFKFKTIQSKNITRFKKFWGSFCGTYFLEKGFSNRVKLQKERQKFPKMAINNQ